MKFQKGGRQRKLWVRELGKAGMFILPGSQPDVFFQRDLLVVVNLQLGEGSVKYKIMCSPIHSERLQMPITL